MDWGPAYPDREVLFAPFEKKVVAIKPIAFTEISLRYPRIIRGGPGEFDLITESGEASLTLRGQPPPVHSFERGRGVYVSLTEFERVRRAADGELIINPFRSPEVGEIRTYVNGDFFVTNLFRV